MGIETIMPRGGPPRRRGKSALPPAAPRPTGAQIVYESLRQAIIALDLEPGAALEETQLCRQYAVSRTPVREALIRLASEGLVELAPNRGAKVASLQFVDVLDHYEAMDIFLPLVCHFAAVRRRAADLDALEEHLAAFRAAVARQDQHAIIRGNHALHTAIAACCHNRSLEKGYCQMLTDKLRLAQHGLRSAAQAKGPALAERFSGTARLSERLVAAIVAGEGKAAERIARELNAYIRAQVVEILATSLATEIELPAPTRRRDDRIIE